MLCKLSTRNERPTSNCDNVRSMQGPLTPFSIFLCAIIRARRPRLRVKWANSISFLRSCCRSKSCRSFVRSPVGSSFSSITKLTTEPLFFVGTLRPKCVYISFYKLHISLISSVWEGLDIINAPQGKNSEKIW